MEVEHVNENMIRVTLESHDLKERGVTVLDLLGNRKQIESFFYNILEEVDTTHTFVKDQTVTFQVIPSHKGLELLITKVPDQKQEDNEEDHDLLQALDVVANPAETDSSNDDLVNLDDPVKTIMFSFSEFEDFVELSKALRVNSVISNLYQLQGQYYLELIIYTDQLRSVSVADIIALAKEYGQLANLSEPMLSEYGHLVMEQSALELTRYYFA